MPNKKKEKRLRQACNVSNMVWGYDIDEILTNIDKYWITKNYYGIV